MVDYDGRRALSVQLARLFGADARIAKNLPKTPAQWKKTLGAVLAEVSKYTEMSVDTDEVHAHMLAGTLAAASEALKRDDFWPGYTEALTRLVFLLLGDYPDHRRKKKGRKDAEHYKLDRLRTVIYTQSPQQRISTLNAAGRYGFPELSGDPIDRLREFRNEYGFTPDLRAFIDWYRKVYPHDYAAIFR